MYSMYNILWMLKRFFPYDPVEWMCVLYLPLLYGYIFLIVTWWWASVHAVHIILYIERANCNKICTCVQGSIINVLSLLNQNNSTILISSWSTFTFNYLGQNLARWLMYLQHFVTSTVSQKLTIPWIRSSLFIGFTSLLKCSFSSCHKFSIGLQSGDSGGVCHQLTPFSRKNCCASLDVCLGPLSWTNRCPFGYSDSIIGSRVCSRMLTYATASIQPSNIQTPDRPTREL